MKEITRIGWICGFKKYPAKKRESIVVSFGKQEVCDSFCHLNCKPLKVKITILKGVK